MMYFGEMALADLEGVDLMVLVETTAPVAFFAYPERPSVLVPAGCETATLARRGEDGAGALAELADRLGAPAMRPSALALPDPQTGPLNPAGAGAAIARHLPEGAIVSDDSVTSGQPILNLTRGAAAARLAGADRRRHRPGHPGGGGRGGRLPRPQGGLAERRRGGDVHGSGPVDPGPRRPWTSPSSSSPTTPTASWASSWAAPGPAIQARPPRACSAWAIRPSTGPIWRAAWACPPSAAKPPKPSTPRSPGPWPIRVLTSSRRQSPRAGGGQLFLLLPGRVQPPEMPLASLQTMAALGVIASISNSTK